MNVAFEIDYSGQLYSDLGVTLAEHEELLKGYGEVLHVAEAGCRRTYVVRYTAEDGWTARGFAEEARRELADQGFKTERFFRAPARDYIADDGSIISLERAR